MSKTNPSLKEIAREAGVSVMAVSYALRNQPGVSEVKRKKIQQIAHRMGYQQDPVLAKLMTQLNRSRRRQGASLAFITDYEEPFEGMMQSKDTRSFEGARQRAVELGYQLIEHRVTREVSGKRLSRILWARGVDGLLIGPLRHGGTALDLEWEHFPAIAIGHSLASPSIHKVSNNQLQSILTALSRMHALGYRRIAVFLKSGSDKRVNHAWRAGYLLACNLLTLPHLGNIFDEQEMPYQQFASWMQREKPDALLIGSTHSPIIEWIQAMKIRVPDDIGLAMLHLMPRDRGLSGIDQRWDAIGRVAAEQLVSRINSHQMGIPETAFSLTLDGRWIKGESTRPQS